MRKILAIILLLASFHSAAAQISQSLLNSPNQQLVETAVEDAFIILQQDYLLLDTATNTRYGWNHQELFNSIYSVGIRVEEGYVVTDRFMTPWKYDTRYINLNNTAYRPIISNTQYRTLHDTTMTRVQYDEQACLPIKDNLLYRTCSIANECRGLTIDTLHGTKEGWLVWLVASDSTLTSDSEPSIVTYRYKLTTDSAVTDYPLPRPAVSGYILSGIYVVPVNSAIGVLDFCMIGAAYHSGDRWHIARVSAKSVPTIAEEETTTILLTPIVSSTSPSNETAEAALDNDNKRRNKRRR